MNLHGRLLLFGLICLGALAATPTVAETGAVVTGTPRDAQRWDFLLRENQIDQQWLQLSNVPRPAYFAITHVSVIAMRDESIRQDMTVVVNNGQIVAMAPSTELPVPAGVLEIDGRDHFLVPGLTDMHVHSLVSNSQPMLNLANGVTSVRDMAGFTWMLALRNRIAAGHLLAPTMYVAGHILNGMPMSFYATAVSSPAAARQVVRDQVAAGYDFIKVHNVMNLEIFAAVLDEARLRKTYVAGHIPHQLTVAAAIGAGLRTLEHFKGYILDQNLTLSEEDYVAATMGQAVWNCPTFYTYRSHLRGKEAHSTVLDSDEMRYVAPNDRRDWRALADQPLDDRTAARQRILPLSQQIFTQLRATDARFLAGTDSGGGLPFLVPGFALHDELRLLQDRGMTPFAALQTATVNAAAALGRSEEFGTIEAGKRADLLLLTANPLESVENLRNITGVAARGRWLDRAVLDQLLGSVEQIYASPAAEQPAALPSVAAVDELIERMSRMRGEGHVYRDFDLDEISDLLRTGGLERHVRTVRALRAQ